MKIINAYPPEDLYERVALATGSKPVNMVFCYGDTVFFPDGKHPYLPPDVQEHEAVHTNQQGDNPSAWWDRYLTDGNFRLSQELEAFRKQFVFCKERMTKPIEMQHTLNFLTMSLMLPAYGFRISEADAREIISNPHADMFWVEKVLDGKKGVFITVKKNG